MEDATLVCVPDGASHGCNQERRRARVLLEIIEMVIQGPAFN